MMHILQHLSTLLAMLFVFNQGDCMQDGIVGGHVAAPHSRPYMVFIALRINNKWSDCDGFLVREDFVMSAAHCKGETMYVFPGLHDKSDLRDKFKVKATPHPHPHHNGATNDIMLLKLHNNVTLSDKVKLVALPEAENAELPTANCVVPGWGAMAYDNDTGSDLLREVNVTVDATLNCETPSKICTRGPQGPFKGDSGGPLVCGDIACGVVSTCHSNDKEHTHYYAKIAHYRHWIDKTMNSFL